MSLGKSTDTPVLPGRQPRAPFGDLGTVSPREASEPRPGLTVGEEGGPRSRAGRGTRLRAE